MDIRPLSPHYAVSPQIAPEDLPEIAAAGFTTVICNRPDDEVPVELSAEVIGVAAQAAGLAFEVLPITHQAMTPEVIAHQAALISAASGPVLAYCASGTRCSVIWALGQASEHASDDILAAARSAGYQLDGLRPMLDQIRAQSQAG